MACGEGELSVDLECGGTTVTSEEEVSGESVSSCGVGTKALNRVCNRALGCNGITSGESHTDSSDDSLSISNVMCGPMELLVNKCSGCGETRDVVALPEKRNPGEPRRKQTSKKYCKPPRPPKGPLLNPSDLKLVKELSEIAARKRARVEQMKALRKVKGTKRHTSSSSLTALGITVIFFVIIVFQGINIAPHWRQSLDVRATHSYRPVCSIILYNKCSKVGCSYASSLLSRQNQPSLARSLEGLQGENFWSLLPQRSQTRASFQFNSSIMPQQTR